MYIVRYQTLGKNHIIQTIKQLTMHFCLLWNFKWAFYQHFLTKNYNNS